MNFLFDENFPRSARTLIESLGHSVIDFREEGIKGSSDEVVMTMAIEQSAVVLTTDRDFFHTIGRQYEGHHGIIVSLCVSLIEAPLWSVCHGSSSILESIIWKVEHSNSETQPGSYTHP